MSATTDLILTCVGRKSYLIGIFEQSDELGTLVAADADPQATVQFHAPIFEQVPPVVSEPDAYVDTLLEVCLQRDLDCVLPQNDLDLVTLADAREQFRQQEIEIAGASPGVVRSVRDKIEMADWMAARDFAYPTTWRPSETPHDELPVIVKSRRGQGSTGLGRIESPHQLADLDDDELVTQQLLEEPEYNLDILRTSGGEVVSVIPKQKLEMRWGATHKARSVDAPELIDLGVELGDAVGHVGSIDVDVMMTADDTPVVIDINPRVGGGFPFTAHYCPTYVDALLTICRGDEPKPFLGDYRRDVRVDREFRYFETSRS